MTDSENHTGDHFYRLAALLLLAALGVVIMRTAWVCDDAYISFRTVWNVAHGYGLTWNPAERVQAFTHPLWVFLLSAVHLLTNDVYHTSLMLSIISAIGAALLLWRLRESARLGLIGLLVLLFSSAWIDYATSGLENALSYLLASVFLTVLFRRERTLRSLALLSLVASLLAVNRLDLLLMVGPVLVGYGWGFPGRRVTLAAAAGFAPLILWESFSIIYYGFPFPNTYYAKMHTGIGAGDLAAQGLVYGLDLINRDPLTAVVIVAGVAIGIFGKDRWGNLLAVGVLLYLLYIVRVGGDFMSGRFFSVPLVVAVGITMRQRMLRNEVALVIAAVVVALGFVAERPTVLSDRTYAPLPGTRVPPANGIMDERAYYYATTGLLSAHRDQSGLEEHRWYQAGVRARENKQRAIAYESVGFFGFAAGPDVHIVDAYGLGDPLLARLPVADTLTWRIGHYARKLPRGYLETLETGENVITDRRIATAYDRIAGITRGEIWSAARFAEIVRMNLFGLPEGTGAVSSEEFQVVPYDSVSAEWNLAFNQAGGVWVKFGRPRRDQLVEITVEADDQYDLRFQLDNLVTGVGHLPAGKGSIDGIRVDTVVVPKEIFERSYNGIVLAPSGPDGQYRVVRVRMLGMLPPGHSAGK